MRVAELSPGGLLRRELQARGWTQAEFATRVGRSGGAIYRVLSDRTPINPQLDFQLSLVLGTPQGHWLEEQQRFYRRLGRQV